MNNSTTARKVQEMTIKHVDNDNVFKLTKNDMGNWENEEAAYIEKHVKSFIEAGIWKLVESVGVEDEPKEDLINKPSHYHSGGIDVITFAESQCTREELRGFYKINVWKYTARAEKKNGLEDYKKAEFYQKRLLELEEKETEDTK